MENKLKKKTKCLKCKRVFETEIDSCGVPYNKICKGCKKNRTSQNRGILSSFQKSYN